MSSTTAIHSLESSESRLWTNPAVILGSAVLIGHAPLAYLHLRSLWLREQYQYFPFVIGAVLYLLWSRWHEAFPPSATSQRWSGWPEAFAVSAVLLLIGAILTVSPWLAFVSLNIGLAAVFALLGRQRAIVYLWGIWFLLWLMVPLPLSVDDRLVRFLQRKSSELSSAILDLLGILHLMTGNVLRLPDKQFFVDEACSGIISVMSMIACAAIYAVWKNRSVLHLIALVLAGVTWALVLNILRICLIAGAYHYFDIDLSTGMVHDLLGLSLFLLMFFALVSTDYLLVMMFSPIDTSLLDGGYQDNFLVRLWNNSVFASHTKYASPVTQPREGVASAGVRMPRTSTAFTWSLPFILLGLVQLVWIPSVDTAEAAQAIEQALALDEEALPARIGPWVRESFETVERESRSEYGRYSSTYRYRHANEDGVMATVSLDFPYQGGWHDLCMCYRNSGWNIEDRVVQAKQDNEIGPWKFVTGNLKDTSEGKAHISFAGFDASGETAEPPSDAVLFRPWFRLRRRLLLKIAPQLFQVQVFAHMSSANDQELKQELEQLLMESRMRFREQVAVQQED